VNCRDEVEANGEETGYGEETGLQTELATSDVHSPAHESAGHDRKVAQVGILGERHARAPGFSQAILPVPEVSGSLTLSELEMWEHQHSKSVKADDASNPIQLWNDRVWSLPHDKVRAERFQQRFGRCALEAIRQRLLCRWRRNVLQSFVRLFT